jgi:hypothetical protein
MHPEMNYAMAKLRHEELVGSRRFARPARARRVGTFLRRRRRDPLGGVATPPAPIVLLPPPREECEPAGHDRRVA